MRWLVIFAVLVALSRSQVPREAAKKVARVPPAGDGIRPSEGVGRGSNDTRKASAEPPRGGEEPLAVPTNATQNASRQTAGPKSGRFTAGPTTELNYHEESDYQDTASYSPASPTYTDTDLNGGQLFNGKEPRGHLEGYVHRIPSNPLMLGEHIIKEGRLCNRTVLPHKEWCNECLCLRGMWLCTNKWCDDRPERVVGAGQGVAAAPARRPSDLLDLLPRRGDPQPLHLLPKSFRPSPETFPSILFPPPLPPTSMPALRTPDLDEDVFDDMQPFNYFL